MSKLKSVTPYNDEAQTSSQLMPINPSKVEVALFNFANAPEQVLAIYGFCDELNLELRAA
ncbi:MAG: hypothetical protein AB1489_24545 [Acidobacteriota bacterium]